MIKKVLVLLVLSALVFTVIGCDGNGAGGNSDAIRVGIVQMIDNGAFTDMREGFIGRLRELGFDENSLVIDYRNAHGDAGTLHSICQAMVSARMDVVVTIATPPTQAFVNMQSDIPNFFISVSNPIQAGVISDLAHPDMNSTGTSNLIPVDELFALADLLTPGIQTFGIIHSAAEINSVQTAESAMAFLDANGINHRQAVVTSSSEVHQAALSLVGNVDAIFVPNDSIVQNAMAQVAQVAMEHGIPIYGSSAVMVESGAFATISIDDYTIGAMTADMVARYLGGTPIEEIPAVVVSDFTMVINTATASALGIELPQDVLDSAVLIG